jgi:hypothetical protein
MVTQPQDMAAIWTQSKIPVVYRQRGSKPVLIRLPYNDDNRTWLKGDHRRKPVWSAQDTHWKVPKSWFEEVVTRCLHRFGRVYVVQPYRIQEKCAPACWNARGFECGCSCLGAYHGCQQPSGHWRIISDTFAVRWHDPQLGCRLMERAPETPPSLIERAPEPPPSRRNWGKRYGTPEFVRRPRA